MIKNIVFDMGEVLLHFDIKAFADRYDISEEDKVLLLEELFECNANWALADWGAITEEEAAGRACVNLPQRLHEAAYGIAMNWHSEIIPVAGMADVVRRVKEAGYGIYLLSNAGSRHRLYWNKVPGSEYFDGIIISAYEKMAKPQPELYKILLERFELDPDECLFVDDRTVNLAGAEKVGMHSVIFRNAEDLTERFKGFGISL